MPLAVGSVSIVTDDAFTAVTTAFSWPLIRRRPFEPVFTGVRLASESVVVPTAAALESVVTDCAVALAIVTMLFEPEVVIVGLVVNPDTQLIQVEMFDDGTP